MTNTDRFYHIVAINEKTGNRTCMTFYPMPHHDACTVLGKINNTHKGRRVQLEEVINGGAGIASGLNLVKLYTHNAVVYVDTAQLSKNERNICTIYTRGGRKLSDTGRTAKIREEAVFGVHKSNLYASKALAAADYERILSEFTGSAK